MLTQQEIYREAVALPFDEQKELVEKLSRNLKRENAENGNKKSKEKELSIEEKKQSLTICVELPPLKAKFRRRMRRSEKITQII
jgi:uncharacterized protein YtpQ (UPF0354 family)